MMPRERIALSIDGRRGTERRQAEKKRSPDTKGCFCGVIPYHFNKKTVRGRDWLRELYCRNNFSGKAHYRREKQEKKGGGTAKEI
jgi:hypothetical protein